MDISLKTKLKKITTFVFDVDGVFTDASLIVGQDDSLRVFNVRDGYAITIALKSGYNMAVISGGKQKSIATRMNNLGIKDVFIDVPTDKKPHFFKEYLASKNISEEETLYLGDDIPDYLVMKNTKTLACCPADAAQEVIDICAYVSTIKGGAGAVRDVIELVMKAQGKWLKVF